MVPTLPVQFVRVSVIGNRSNRIIPGYKPTDQAFRIHSESLPPSLPVRPCSRHPPSEHGGVSTERLRCSEGGFQPAATRTRSRHPFNHCPCTHPPPLPGPTHSPVHHRDSLPLSPAPVSPALPGASRSRPPLSSFPLAASLWLPLWGSG